MSLPIRYERLYAKPHDNEGNVNSDLADKMATCSNYVFSDKIVILIPVKEILKEFKIMFENKKCHSHVTNAPKGIGLA